MDSRWSNAGEIAAAVSSRRVTAEQIVEQTLAAIQKHDPTLNSFTHVTAERALSKARAIDTRLDKGQFAGTLAGVPFAVKNLIDIAGLSTLAGSKINADNPPATQDSPLVERLETAGAILVGALGMAEYAYGFTGENSHYGPGRNPHDPARMAGGTSSGAGSAVGGGLVPVALGSDTSGSIRVPCSYCGTFGLKPTYGRLSRALSFPFVASLDHLGPLARSVKDLALVYDAVQGPDPNDPVCADRPIEPVLPQLERGTEGLRVAVLGGHFAWGMSHEAKSAVESVAQQLGTDRVIELPEADRARSAAFVITAAEGGTLHLNRLKKRVADFDPETRYRFIAGTMVPATLVVQAQKFRRWFRDAARRVFESVDILIAPAVPTTAPLIGEKKFVLEGQEVLIRPNIGMYTQPISFIGLPVVSVPVPVAALPMGVQIIAPAWREDLALRVAYALESAGTVAFRKPRLLA